MAVTGKVILKVKSGPGTLIGEVEADIIDDAVSFKGLKFDQPGDYVVSVTSTSTFVEFSEFSVKILPEEISLEQPQKNSQEEEKKPEEKPKPIITQVDQPKVDLPPMTFDNTKSERDDKLVASQIGLTPFINYMGSPINDRDIKMLILSHDGIIPTIDFMFDDSNGLNVGNYVKSEFRPSSSKDSNAIYYKPKDIPRLTTQQFDELYSVILSTKKPDGTFPGGNSTVLSKTKFKLLDAPAEKLVSLVLPNLLSATFLVTGSK